MLIDGDWVAVTTVVDGVEVIDGGVWPPGGVGGVPVATAESLIIPLSTSA